MPTKNNFFPKFVWFITYYRYIYSISVYKDKKLLKSHETVDFKVFLIFMLVHVTIRISEAQKRTDQKPEHCTWENNTVPIYLLRLSFMLHVMPGTVIPT
jgi:hypothetical protein